MKESIIALMDSTVKASSNIIDVGVELANPIIDHYVSLGWLEGSKEGLAIVGTFYTVRRCVRTFNSVNQWSKSSKYGGEL